MSYIQGGGGGGSSGGGLPQAGANLVYYVATTGSDSNSGLSALAPFATIQHALNVVQGFDYQNLYFPTINVANGTYPVGSKILQAGQLTNLSGSGLLIGNSSTPGNVIISDAIGVGCFTNQGLNSKWTLNGFQLDSTGFMLVGVGSFMSLLNMNYTDSTESGNASIWNPQGFSHMDTGGANSTFTSTILATNLFGVVQADLFAHMTIADLSLNYPVAGLTVFAGVLNGFDNAEILYQPLAQPNSGAVLSKPISLVVESFVATVNGSYSDLPGTQGTHFAGDDTCALVALTSGFASMFANVKSGAPTATDVPAGTWSVWKDTTGGGVVVAYNDAGVIKKVALV